MDLRRQFAVARAWFPLLVVAVILGGGAAFVLSNLQKNVYEARATLLVGQSLSTSNPDYNQLLASQRLSTTYARVATTRPVLDSVIKQLGLGVTTSDLAGRVHADAPQDSTLVTITAQDSDAARASAIANALADQLVAMSPSIAGRQADAQSSFDAELQATQDLIKSTQAQLDALSALPTRSTQQDADLQTLEGRLVTLRSTYATLLSLPNGTASNLLSVVEPAVPPDSPVSPKLPLNTLVGALLGLLAAAGIAFLVEYLDGSVRDPETVRSVVGLGTLGMVAEMGGDHDRSEIYRLVTLLHPHSADAEAYRTLRTNIEFASLDASPRTLLVTSSSPREGKTVTAANLAVVFAQAGWRVLLVDADLRRPGVHLIFDLPNAHGLTTLLRNPEARLESATHSTEQEDLRVLTTGPLPANPAELLRSSQMQVAVERLKADAQLVIFDSPPLRTVTDPAILSSFVDETLLVVDTSHARRRAVVQGRDALDKVGARVLGAVLNRVPARARAEDAAYYQTSFAPPQKVTRGQTTATSPEHVSPSR